MLLSLLGAQTQRQEAREAVTGQLHTAQSRGQEAPCSQLASVCAEMVTRPGGTRGVSESALATSFWP